MSVRVDEVADGVVRISVHSSDGLRGVLVYNQFLILGERPLLVHTGMRTIFPLVVQQQRPAAAPGLRGQQRQTRTLPRWACPTSTGRGPRWADPHRNVARLRPFCQIDKKLALIYEHRFMGATERPHRRGPSDLHTS